MTTPQKINVLRTSHRGALHLSYPFSIEDWNKAWEELEDFADQAYMD